MQKGSTAFQKRGEKSSTHCQAQRKVEISFRPSSMLGIPLEIGELYSPGFREKATSFAREKNCYPGKVTARLNCSSFTKKSSILAKTQCFSLHSLFSREEHYTQPVLFHKNILGTGIK